MCYPLKNQIGIAGKVVDGREVGEAMQGLGIFEARATNFLTDGSCVEGLVTVSEQGQMSWVGTGEGESRWETMVTVVVGEAVIVVAENEVGELLGSVGLGKGDKVAMGKCFADGTEAWGEATYKGRGDYNWQRFEESPARKENYG